MDTKLCCLCKSSEETIIHLLWDCPKVKELVTSIITLCYAKGINITLDNKSFIFGINVSKEINFILLIIKSYIYRKRCRQESLSIQELQTDLKTHITTLKYTATQQGKYNECCINQWNTWLFLLDRPWLGNYTFSYLHSIWLTQPCHDWICSKVKKQSLSLSLSLSLSYTTLLFCLHPFSLHIMH